jgi:hypothetical protein
MAASQWRRNSSGSLQCWGKSNGKGGASATERFNSWGRERGATVVPHIGDNVPAAPWYVPVSPVLGLRRVRLGRILNR